MPLKCGPNIKRYTAVGDGIDPDPNVALILALADFAVSSARIQAKIAKLKATPCPDNCNKVRQGEIAAPVLPSFTFKWNPNLKRYHAHIKVGWVWQVRCV
ncbi:MAG TPA: hypothetical protein VLQ90_00025 [Pyrinomonadaceae bacterium]|nr:hypothetical protein [Pyrinomonadaceae bacterium]